MKRFISFVLSLLLVVSFSTVSIAEEDVTFADLTTEDLHALIDGARNELAKRELVAAEDVVLFEQEGVTVYLTGKYEIKQWSDGSVMELQAVVVNDSESDVGVYIDTCEVNGWEVYGGAIININAGKKKKDTFEIRLYDADIETYEEIEDICFAFHVSDASTYKTIFKVDPVTVYFNE